MQSATITSVYEELGVQPLINARGNATVLGGSTPSPRVKAAMEQADRYFVDMQELLRRTGEIVAGLLGTEAGYVTPGAAAAMALGTAACITGSDVEKMARLPDTEGLRNRVVMQAAQQYAYQRAVTIVGTTLQFVGDESGTTAEQFDAALGAEVACVLYPALLEKKPGVLSIDRVREIARAKGIPLLIDAAGEVSPVERFKKMAQSGDLVCFGSKYFGGLNSAGLLVGRRDLVEAASAQGFIGFETVTNRKGFGRPFKIDRQEIVGATVALQEWLSLDHARRNADIERRLGVVSRAIEGLPGVRAEVVEREESATRVLHVRLDPGAKRDVPGLIAGLREGSPGILCVADGDALRVALHTVREGDEDVIAQRLRELLR